MNFRYAVRATISRFSLVWSILVYSLIVLFVVSSLCITVLLPLINAITNLESFAVLNERIRNFGDGTIVFADILTDISTLYTDIIDRISGYSWSVVVSIIVVVVFGRFIIGLMELPLSSCVHARMTAKAKTSFTGAYFANLGRSGVYQLSKMMFTVPFDIIMFFITYFTARLLSHMAFVALLSPMIIILELCALIALKTTLFCCWHASLVVDNKKVFDGMRFSVRASVKNFGVIFSLLFISTMLSIGTLFFMTIFTFGAGLLIAFPTIVLFFNILTMLIYYTSRGHRFYIDNETIISPPTPQTND